MATFLAGLTDQLPVIQPFQPDFNMVQKALGTLQSKYDQGFASVQNAYNQVLNAPLTNSKLRESRESYVRDSERRLKDLSSVDLSLYENQVAAEQVFAPFWQDKRFLKDTYLTKEIQREMQRGMAARNSSDEKVREQYNDLSMRYLQSGLERLQDVDPDSGEFARLQPRRWVPFANLEKYLNDLATQSKLEINWKSPSGPYLIETKNGERSLVPFKTWAHNMLGNNFKDQFDVMGTVEREDGVKQLMRWNPKLTEAEATAQLARNTMTSLNEGYVNRLGELSSSIKQMDSKMKWYLDKPLGEEDEAEFRRLVAQKKEMVDQERSINNQYKEFSDNYTTKLGEIERNPDRYFAQFNKQRVVDGWAAARASQESVNIDINPVLKEQRENQFKQEELKYKYAQLDLQEREFRAHLVDTDGDGVGDRYVTGSGGKGTSTGTGLGGSGSVSSSGGGGGKGSASQTVLSGRNIGKGITDVSKTGSAYEVLSRHQSDRWNIAHENFFDMNGLGRVLVLKLGEDETLARNYISELRRKILDPEHYTIDDKDGWFSKISEELGKASNVKVTDESSARDALVVVGGQYLKEKLSNGGKLTDSNDREMVRRYMTGINALHQYRTTQENIKEQVEKVFNTSHEYDIMKQEHGGKPGIIEAKDLAKLFKHKEYEYDGKKISAETLARYYMQGEAKWEIENGGGTVATFGPYQVLVDPFYKEETDDMMTDILTLDAKYGSSEQFKKKLDNLNNKIVPGIFEYQNQTGKYGYKIKYDLGSGVDNEFSAQLLSDLSNADNQEAIYEGEQLSKNDDMNKAILSLLGQGEEELEKYISAVTLNTSGRNGRPTVDISFAPIKDNDSTKIGDYNLKDLAGKQISIELNPNGSGQAVRSIRFNPGFYVYGDLLRGKRMESDAMLRAAGFDFSILPNDDKNPTEARLVIQRTVFDETTGKNKTLKPIERRILFGQQTPDEVMSMIYGLLDDHLAGNVAANERYETRVSVGKKTGRQVLEEMNARYSN